jgi:hypothetical protein
VGVPGGRSGLPLYVEGTPRSAEDVCSSTSAGPGHDGLRLAAVQHLPRFCKRLERPICPPGLRNETSDGTVDNRGEARRGRTGIFASDADRIAIIACVACRTGISSLEMPMRLRQFRANQPGKSPPGMATSRGVAALPDVVRVPRRPDDCLGATCGRCREDGANEHG